MWVENITEQKRKQQILDTSTVMGDNNHHVVFIVNKKYVSKDQISAG